MHAETKPLPLKLLVGVKKDSSVKAFGSSF